MICFLRSLLGHIAREVGHSCRGKIFAAAVVCCGFLALASPARADEASALRLGITGGVGGLFSPGHGSIPHPTGDSQDFYSGGMGVDLRIGAQLGPYVAIDAQVFGETFLLGGDMRAGALLEVSPVPQFAFSIGGGVGTMAIVNFYFDSPSADFASGFVRLEGRLTPARNGEARPKETLFVFGLECQLGYVFKGSIPEGSLLVGPRAFGGVLWR